MISLSPIHRVFAGFACYSFAMGNIFPRLADVQSGMGVSTAALGFGLIGAPLGTLVSFTFASPYLDKIGYGRLLPWALPLLAALYALAVHAPTPLILFLMLLPVGVVIGCIEIMLNAEADRTEFLLGRRIMNRSHAFWSIGFFLARRSQALASARNCIWRWWCHWWRRAVFWPCTTIPPRHRAG